MTVFVWSLIWNETLQSQSIELHHHCFLPLTLAAQTCQAVMGTGMWGHQDWVEEPSTSAGRPAKYKRNGGSSIQCNGAFQQACLRSNQACPSKRTWSWRRMCHRCLPALLEPPIAEKQPREPLVQLEAAVLSDILAEQHPEPPY